jgi:epoxyqueuosine reductase QueG
MTEIKKQVVQFLQTYHVHVVGFGRVPDDVTILEVEQLPRAIVVGIPLSKSVLATVTDRPSLIYKHHYKTVNWILDQTAFHLVQFIETKGARAIAVPASQTIDWENQRGHISHKTLARAAGLGHIGRSGLLIHPTYGAQVRYVSVLTDLHFAPDAPLETDCGTCTKCITVCPAHAISEQGVNIKQCYEKLREFSRIRGIGQYICGVCVKVCNGRD